MSIKELLNQRKLPDLFTLPSGEKVSDIRSWEQKMRPYWKNLLLEEEYGVFPEVLQPKVEKSEFYIDFGGKAVWENIIFTFERNGKTCVIPTKLIYPKNAKNLSFCICLDFFSECPSPYLPVEEIIDRGVGVFAVCYQDVTNDKDDFSSGIAGLFEENERKGNASGKIVYWSYMAMRMMDYLLTRKEANKNKIGVSGHSRLGKTALLTCAFDERFAFCIVNQSGCSGAALSRMVSGGAETLADIYNKFPYWFCPNYSKYLNKESDLPFDQHCLLSLVAPRIALIGAAQADLWADNLNQFLSCASASEVWDLYQIKGFENINSYPQDCGVFMGGNLGFYLRKGTHFLSRNDWQIYLKKINEIF